MANDRYGNDNIPTGTGAERFIRCGRFLALPFSYDECMEKENRCSLFPFCVEIIAFLQAKCGSLFWLVRKGGGFGLGYSIVTACSCKLD